MIRLLLADDEDLIRGALAALLDLEDDLEIVAQAATTTEAVNRALMHRPDIVVLDLEMPPAGGIEAATRILEQFPTRVVLVTRHARPGVLRRALAAGVVGFVPKTTPAARLAEILRDIHSGRRYVDPDIAASALAEDDCPLTDRELEVLHAARTGVSVEEIAQQVHLAPGTVRNYLSNVMTKLQVSTRHAAAHHAWEQGWDLRCQARSSRWSASVLRVAAAACASSSVMITSEPSARSTCNAGPLRATTPVRPCTSTRSPQPPNSQNASR